MQTRARLPPLHIKPSDRVKDSTSVSVPPNFPISPLIPKTFRSESTSSKPPRELIYDPSTPHTATQPQFSGDFEGGNLGRVYRVGLHSYEIHVLPDPGSSPSSLWYFFKVSNIPPGEYHFTITNLRSTPSVLSYGVQPTALLMNSVRSGIGWQRFGENLNFWRSKKDSSHSLYFEFTVSQTDTMYFAFVYPYTYSDLCSWIAKQPAPFASVTLCNSLGGIAIPIVFWDAETQGCRNPLTVDDALKENCKPLIVIAARHHPGESVASYAMEGFMNALFAGDSQLRDNFSFLLIPMINVDGVVCGYQRSSLSGYDMNRSWVSPNAKRHPVEFAIVQLLDKLVKSRRLLFLLDYHGHTSQSNAFTYGVGNPKVKDNQFQGLFPREMARQTSIFDIDGGCTLVPDVYTATMRVALHHRYKIPFSYTLEMSYGALDIGPLAWTQLTPNSYREVGVATVRAIRAVLLHQIPRPGETVLFLDDFLEDFD